MVVVQRLVFFVLLFLINLRVLLALPIQMTLSCAFRAHGAQRNHFL